jgi:predicted RNase H-like HicB family nuclease
VDGDQGAVEFDIMKDSARYAKIVEWSEEDQCYVGSSPGLMLGGCHGQDEREVFDQLCQIVEEVIELYKEDGKPLPPSTESQDSANKMQDIA